MACVSQRRAERGDTASLTRCSSLSGRAARRLSVRLLQPTAFASPNARSSGSTATVDDQSCFWKSWRPGPNHASKVAEPLIRSHCGSGDFSSKLHVAPYAFLLR
ncbi:unnamed protein product [Prorocentrum cordatum]|uniref:Uncharacterized protein n=1 Tax=Prorocentrum cordatum TaxID=2364126 RepID=A0ABN9RPV9_9DINO|nr:unnamed protein product [Polarella glacialis]